MKYVEIFGLFDSPGNSMLFALTIKYGSLERSKHRSVLAIFIERRYTYALNPDQISL